MHSELIERWMAHEKPQTDEARRLVEEAVMAVVVLRRIERIENRLIAESGEALPDEAVKLGLRYLPTWSKRMHRAIEGLRRIAAETGRAKSQNEANGISAQVPSEKAVVIQTPTVETGAVSRRKGAPARRGVGRRRGRLRVWSLRRKTRGKSQNEANGNSSQSSKEFQTSAPDPGGGGGGDWGVGGAGEGARGRGWGSVASTGNVPIGLRAERTGLLVNALARSVRDVL